MSDVLEALGSLSAAEEFFDYLSVPYEPAVLHVSRLHILQRFHQYLRSAVPGLADLEPEGQHDTCRALLRRAYDDFLRSTPAQEKVFKIFQDADGGRVGLDSLLGTLPSRARRT